MPQDTRLSFSEIFQQFRTPDLVRFYTPVYSWLVNQFGHALAGFAVSLIVASLLTLFAPISPVESIAITIILGGLIYLKKELGDIKRLSSKDEDIHADLQISVEEIKADAIMDWCFVFVGVVIGAFTAGAILNAGTYLWTVLALISFGVFWVLLLWPGQRYLVNKTRWQRSGLPFLIDIAHCKPAVVNAQVAHFRKQISENIESQRYVGSFTTVMQIMVGVARRRMAVQNQIKRRVRYWHAQELTEHLQGNLSSTSDQWTLDEADINIVWVAGHEAPTLTSAQLAVLKQKTWLFGSDQTEVAAGWDLLIEASPIELVS